MIHAERLTSRASHLRRLTLAILLTPYLVPVAVHAQSVTVPRVVASPRLADFTDVNVPPSFAAGMAKIEGLIQRAPVDGAPISEKTVVYLGSDNRHLYVVFVCAGPPGAIRAHRVNRDRIPDDDDSVAIHLDTFSDRRRLYGFQVNPAGVQVDGIYTEGQGWDLSFDTVWTADTATLPNGYVVLITIPFSSLRFPKADEQRWGLFVYRGLPRKNEEAFWPAYSTRNQGRLAYAAEMRGLHDIGAGHNLQILPYGTFRGERAAGPADAPRSNAVRQALEGRVGLDVKTAPRENLVLDLTANPDFSQVESDEPQTTVNRRFEVFFPERRPFFIENASYFETPIPVLFTRRIREPQVGARFSGKAGKFAVGALVADDVVRENGGAASGRIVTSVARVSRDLGLDSQIGVIYAGRDGAEHGNHAAGLDGRWRLTSNLATAVQAVASQTRDEVAASFGTAYRASLDASSQHYVSNSAYSDVSPGFRVDSGFVPRTDIREISHSSTIVFRPATRRVTSWGPTVTVGRVWDHDRVELDRHVRGQLNFELARQTQASVFHTQTDERLRVQDSPRLSVATLFRQRVTGIGVGSAPVAGLVFRGEYAAGTAINLSPAPGGLPVLSNVQTTNVTIGLRPAPAFTVDTTYLWTRLADIAGGRMIFSDHIIRSRWNYQLSRRLSLRAIVRYEDLLANPAGSTLQAHRDVNADVLFTYLVQPGTALYVGLNADESRVATIARGQQIFVKLSYRFHQ